MRYIEPNPVRAGMVQHPGEYLWSNFAVNAQGQPDTMLTRHPLYLSLGKSRQQREYAYRDLFRQDLVSGEVHEIREALNRELVPGRESFKDRIEETLNRQTRSGVPGRPRIEDGSGHYSAFCLY
jgi:putative transposase